MLAQSLARLVCAMPSSRLVLKPLVVVVAVVVVVVVLVLAVVVYHWLRWYSNSTWYFVCSLRACQLHSSSSISLKTLQVARRVILQEVSLLDKELASFIPSFPLVSR